MRKAATAPMSTMSHRPGGGRWPVKAAYKLCVNNSYSGSTVGYRGYDGNDYSDRSFITRMDNLGNPDIILIFGATNDSWAGEEVGAYKYGQWTKGDFYTFRPAMAYMLDHVKKRYPNVKVYFLLNSELRDDINESCLTICQHYASAMHPAARHRQDQRASLHQGV